MSLQVGDSERFVEAAAHIAAYPWLDASVRAEFFAYAENYTRKWFPRLRPSLFRVEFDGKRYSPHLPLRWERKTSGRSPPPPPPIQLVSTKIYF